MPVPYFALGGDLLVNPGLSSGPQIVYLTGGRFVVMGQNRSGMSPATTYFQVYSATGDKIGAKVTLSGTLSDSRSDPSIAGISGDRFVVTYVASGGSELRAQIYDAGGAAVGSSFVVATASGQQLSDGEVIALADGGFLVNWGRSPGSTPITTLAQRYDSAGSAVGPAFTITGPTTRPEVTELAGGEFVYTWIAGSSNFDVHAAMFAADGTPIGASFQVNNVTAGRQTGARIASLGSGGFVIVWADENATDVKAQIYDAVGVAVGGEFMVNSTTTGSQSSPSVVALPAGGFLVSWTDGSGTGGDASGTSIKGQYFEDSGVKVGNEVLLNTTTLADQSSSALAVSSTGDLAVGYIHLENPNSAANRELRVQLFEPVFPTADTYAASPDFALATPANGGMYPMMTALAGGGFALSWEASTATGGEIRTQAYDALGHKIGSETLLATTGLIPLTSGSGIGALSGGGYVVVWHEDTVGSWNVDAYDVKAQRFDAGGNAVGAEIDLSTITANGQLEPAVAGLPGGGFVAAWTDRGGSGGDGAGSSVKAQLFDALGAKVGGEFRVNTSSPSDQIAPSITALSGDRFLISWATNSAGGGVISAQLYEANGTAIGSELTVATGINPSVTELAGGGFVIAWQAPAAGSSGGQGEIRAQIFDSAGNEVGAELAVNDNVLNTQRDPVVAALPDGRFIVAWTSFVSPGGNDFGVKAQIFDAAGHRFGGEFLVNQISAGSQSSPSIAVLANGDFLIGWSDNGVIEARLFSAAAGAEAQGDAFAINEASPVSGNVFADNGSGFDLMPFGNAFIVAEVNGASAAVGQTIILASGALLTLNANGSFNYNPNDAFNSLVAPGSGSPSQATDSFTYGVYGDTATVTITISGLDPAAGTVEGTAGNDALVGTAAGETLDAFEGNDYLFGLGAADTLIGGAGNDYLDGGAGADAMRGGLGNDIYLVDDAGDVVTEVSGGGFDQLYSGTTFSLAAGAEIEVLSVNDYGATTAINLTGNAFGQQIFGNNGANTLNGGGGFDAFYGGGGNDTYFIDHDDVVVEGVGGGNDTVYTSDGFVLVAGVEVEVLSAANTAGTTAINFYGNEFAQQIIGNAGANFLIGGGGADTINGGAGNDIYIIDGTDSLIDAVGGGFDQAYSSSSFTLTAGASIEVLAVNDYGATTAIDLVGNALGQQVFGNAGANVLDGGGGIDQLFGRGGADTFQFSHGPGGGNFVFVADFSAADDTIALDDAVFAGLAPGALNPNAFVVGTAAQDADDRIIYNSANGQLLYDADGNGSGAAIHFATLTGAPAITASDFIVI